MSKRSGLYPHVRVDTATVPAVAHAGGALLTRTTRVSGIDRLLSEALRPWRKPLARHDPAKVVLDVAVSLALGGDAGPRKGRVLAGQDMCDGLVGVSGVVA